MDKETLSRRTFLKLAGLVGTVAAIEGIDKYGGDFGLKVVPEGLKSLPPVQSYPSPYASGDLIPPELEPSTTPPQQVSSLPLSSLIPPTVPDFTHRPLQTETPKPTSSPEIKHEPAPVLFYGDRTKPKIYLTVDDCWDPRSVEAALEVAQRYKIKLTFFPIGKNVSYTPSLYKEAAQRGHEIENHTWTHEWLAGQTPSEIEYQILKQKEAVQNAIGQNYSQYFLRPPGGSGIYGGYYRPLLDVCGRLGYKIAMWSSDSNGWRKHPSTDAKAENYILQNVFSNFFKGVIVLQHAIPGDIIALPFISNSTSAGERLANGYDEKSMKYTAANIDLRQSYLEDRL